MEKDKGMIALMVISIIIVIAAIVFLVISIAGKSSTNWPLAIALLLIVIANVLNIIRIKIISKKK